MKKIVMLIVVSICGFSSVLLAAPSPSNAADNNCFRMGGQDRNVGDHVIVAFGTSTGSFGHPRCTVAEKITANVEVVDEQSLKIKVSSK